MATDKAKLAKAEATLRGQGQQDEPRSSADLAISDSGGARRPPQGAPANEAPTRPQPGPKPA